MERIEAIDFIVLNLGRARTVHNWGNTDISSPFARIYYVKEGHAQIYLDGRTLDLTPGHMYLLPTFLPHSYMCDPGFEFYYLFVYQRMSSGADIFQTHDLPMEVKANEATQLLFENYCMLYPQLNLPSLDAESFDQHPAYREYALAYMHMPEYERLQLHGLVEILFSYFLKHGTLRAEVADPRLARALEYIQQHLNETITIEQLSECACMTRSNLTRCFNKALQVTPLQYVLSQKIHHAQSLLLSSDMSVREIAQAVGFTDASYFIRLFRKNLGLTPQDYRVKLIG